MPDTPQPAPKHTAGDPGSVLEFPGTPEGGRPPHNLPLQLSSFIGRGREVAEVETLLSEQRLLMLTGPGGSGKTRLALAVASRVADDFRDGTWVVELAPLSDADLVPQAVASVLGVRETPGTALVDSLRAHLQPRSTLLVLDNCEHLVGASAFLAETLLRHCPHLRILATSREALGVSGETIFAVPPLSLPDPHRLPTVQSLPQYEAARLFVDRAKAVKADFALTESNAIAIAQVCQRLEGIPLAIELAAARARVLSVQQISSRLNASFDLLTGGGRTALAHQRTLRTAMDWSHDLLSEEERILLRRLSVFAGGWTLDAAEAVCGGGGLEGDEILDLLAELVDKSLVLVTEQDREDRYRLLETVGQYAREKLEQAGEDTAVGRSHAEFFLRFAERAEPELKGHRQVAWLERLERDHDNLRAAMRHFVDHGEMESAARLAWALWFFWRAHGYQGEGYRYTGEALEPEDTLSTNARATLLCVRGIMSYGLESTESTEQLWKRSADMFRQTDDRSGLALALGGLSLMALARGDMELSTTRFGESMTLYRELGDRWGMGSVLVHEGLIPLSRGEYTQAVRYFEEGLEIAQEIGDRLIWGHALHHLAWASQLQENQERAARFYVEGLGVAAELGDGAGVAYCLEGIASLVATESEPEHKARLFGASEAILETVGAPLYVQIQDRAMYNRAVEELRSRLGEEAFEAAWAQGRAMTPKQAIEYALAPPSRPAEPAASAYPAGLSTREVEVLRLVARGMTNTQLAGELYISPRTVNAHLGSVYRKIGSSTRAEATRFASEQGLL